MRRNGGFRTPVPCFIAVRPGDRLSIIGLAGTFLKIGVASFLVRASLAACTMLLLLVLVAIARW